MRRPMAAGMIALAMTSGAVHVRSARAAQDVTAEVFAAERAFAKSMADRDIAEFERHLSKEAIFYGQGVARGAKAVVAEWKPFFDGPTAPFSWEPTSVQVLESGTLALSSGPVRSPDGQVRSTFNSVWRREPDGVWRVVFDKGCQCPPPPKPGDVFAACGPI